ncbi:MAG TPA: arabinose-proton symporter [Phycisphaerales bacterium]|nr:arabinose-proton symporter [Phycisphaerales bacterium]
MDIQTVGRNVNHKGSVGYLLVLSFVAALGGLLFGYDTAVISGAIGFMKTKFALSTMMTGWVASSALVGCIFGAMLAGVLSDKFGRKKVLVLSAVCFFISAVWSGVPYGLFDFVIARILGGLGVGAASMLSPMYIAEISPARLRGRLVSLNQFAIISGMLLVYFINSIIAGQGTEQWNINYGWRWMFGSEAIPAMLFFIFLFFVPESPRWLTEKNRESEALRILKRIGGSEHAQKELLEIRNTIVQESSSFWQLFRPGIRVAMLIGVGLAILQQITGINIILYYAPEIFKSAGLATTSAISDTVIVGIVNLTFTFVAIAVVDKVGRKPLLLFASAGMGISMFLLGRAFRLEQFEGKLVLIYVLTYVASFAVAMGPVVWVVISEIFPTKVRGRAMSMATVCLWISCYLVSQFFPYLLESLKGGVFWLYGGICAIAFVFVLVVVSETKGRSLEEIERSWVKERKL